MAKYISMKVANMRNGQDFILYPYSGGDEILLQSKKRFARVNLRTGEGIINGKNENYPNSIKLAMSPVKFTLPEEVKTEIQGYLWHNNGKDGNDFGVISYENKPLFSNK
jgi:hypothetical protein